MSCPYALVSEGDFENETSESTWAGRAGGGPMLRGGGGPIFPLGDALVLGPASPASTVLGPAAAATAAAVAAGLLLLSGASIVLTSCLPVEVNSVGPLQRP